MCSNKIFRCTLIKNHQNNLLFSDHKIRCRSFELNLFSHCFNFKDLNVNWHIKHLRKDLLFALQITDLTNVPNVCCLCFEIR